MKNIAVIGAGASGLFLAHQLVEQQELQVYVFEKNKNIGTKLRASGGGKANIFNEHIQPEDYNDPDSVRPLLQQVTPTTLRNAFEQMGLALIVDEEGRVYPCTEFSQTVVDILWNPENPNLHPELEYEVKHIFSQDGEWHINDYPVTFDHVVIATGTPANLIEKNRKGYNTFLTDFNLQTQPFQPSLVGFKIKDYPKMLSGCRTKVIASLYQGQNLIHKESGEVTFKDDGISGIVILNLSAYYNRLANKDNCHLELNLLPSNPELDIKHHLQQFHSLKGILHPKLNLLYEQKPFDVKKFKMEIADTYEMEYAQVCHGGIDMSEVNADFSLKKNPDVFVTGEVLNIDGICGGYNLFFAFASAMVVAQHLIKNH